MDYEMKMPDLATTGSPIKVVRWLVPGGQHVHRGEPAARGRDRQGRHGGGEPRHRPPPVVGRRRGRGSLRRPGDRGLRRRTGSRPGARATIAPPIAEPPRPVPAQIPAPPAARAPDRSFFARNREARRQRAARPRSRSRVPSRVVARQMVLSKQTIPHFYLQTSANAGPMAARRRAAAGEGKPPVWDAFFVHAAAQGPAAVPEAVPSLRGRRAGSAGRRRRRPGRRPRGRALHPRPRQSRRSSARAALRRDPRGRGPAPLGRSPGPDWRGGRI